MSILKRPVVSEKATRQGEKLRQYGFIVDRNANKIQIKKAVEQMYGVTVESVNTMLMRGKTVMRGTKSGMTKGIKGRNKKAVVTVKDGDVIDFYSSI
ncbi:MAG: 50S ribosomal protein L23 [Bacteroidia bacterium]|nr:50S ribosomal protein L23 [Bacteroidia bacterium]